MQENIRLFNAYYQQCTFKHTYLLYHNKNIIARGIELSDFMNVVQLHKSGTPVFYKRKKLLFAYLLLQKSVIEL